MNYELLIFDWDGTLLDSAGQIVATMQQAIAELGLAPREDEQIRRLIGLGLNDALLKLYPDADQSELMDVMQSYRRRYSSTPEVYGEAFPGVEGVLHELRLQGRRLAVATGKSRRGLDRALNATGWQEHFVATRCADETSNKPDPQMLQELLLELGVSPAAALMIGDTSYDMEMARRAGVDAVAVAWGVHEREELETAGARAVLDGVHHLPPWLA